MIKVAVCGANGKMGKELVNAINNDSQAELVAKIDIVNGEFSRDTWYKLLIVSLGTKYQKLFCEILS